MDETSVSLRDRLIEAAAEAIYDEEGPECIDDDGAEALATVALRAIATLLADEIEHMPIRYSRDLEVMADRHAVQVDAAKLVRAAGVL